MKFLLFGFFLFSFFISNGQNTFIDYIENKTTNLYIKQWFPDSTNFDKRTVFTINIYKLNEDSMEIYVGSYINSSSFNPNFFTHSLNIDNRLYILGLKRNQIGLFKEYLKGSHKMNTLRELDKDKLDDVYSRLAHNWLGESIITHGTEYMLKIVFKRRAESYFDIYSLDNE